MPDSALADIRLGRVALEKFAVLFRGEIEKSAVVSGGKFRLALHRLVVGEKRDRVVALDGDALLSRLSRVLVLAKAGNASPKVRSSSDNFFIRLFMFMTTWLIHVFSTTG